MRLRASLSSALLLLSVAGPLGCRTTFNRGSVQPVTNTDSVIHYPGEGGVIVSASRRRSKGICIAPPSQSAAVYSTKRSTSGKTSATFEEVEISAEGERTVDIAATLSRLYEQNEQTLFVQHALYRLCEAYMNGLFDETPYRVWVVDELRDTNVKLAEAQADAAKLSDAQARVAAERKELARIQDERERLQNDLRDTALAPGPEAAAARKKRESLERLAVSYAKDAEAARVALANAEAEVSNAQRAKELAGALAEVKGSLQSVGDTAKEFEDKVSTELAKCTEPSGIWKRRKETLATCQERLLSRMSRTSYLHAVRDVFETAERLSELDVERTRARAELAKAEAAKAKQTAEAEKAKAKAAAEKAKTDKTAAAYKALVESLTEASVKRASCTTNCKDTSSAKAEEPKKDEKKK